MRFKLLASTIIVFLALIMIPTASYAELKKVWFNAWTTNYTDSAEKQMNFWVEVSDTVKKNPPTFVATIKITAPDGTVLNFRLIECRKLIDFAGSRQIFHGT
jgi:hypothetical protein